MYVRNYGQGKKWIPGRVKSATGARMITVETPGVIVRRHVDQVRRRPDSPPMFPVADTTAPAPGATQTPGPNTAINETLPLETVNPENPPSTDHVAEDNIQPRQSPLPTISSPAAAPQQVLRRSTRQRKPVQRFHF
ncbi:hypothetical protein MTO96_049454 [Rhipicephalus appendiculatus]